MSLIIPLIMVNNVLFIKDKTLLITVICILIGKYCPIIKQNITIIFVMLFLKCAFDYLKIIRRLFRVIISRKLSISYNNIYCKYFKFMYL